MKAMRFLLQHLAEKLWLPSQAKVGDILENAARFIAHSRHKLKFLQDVQMIA